jgi:hypothetical protein
MEGLLANDHEEYWVGEGRLGGKVCAHAETVNVTASAINPKLLRIFIVCSL